ncbi:MAG: helix-turn-helix transcriptional regulator [Candidatus Pacebacteria bacterium]|nr:helix-turn-helix transcriptional regulator [Candidatus Paceibacterota bacterium]
MSEKTKTLKVKVKEFRVKSGLTQEELAERVGVRRETIVFLEQGRYNPSLKLALNISKELKASVEELFSL